MSIKMTVIDQGYLVYHFYSIHNHVEIKSFFLFDISQNFQDKIILVWQVCGV